MTDETTQPSRGGRLFVLGVLYLLAVYVGVAVIGSIAASLYRGPPAHASSEAALHARQRTWCITQLMGLGDELEAEVTHELSHPKAAATAPARFETFRARWEVDLQEATERCSHGFEPAMADAYQVLTSLYESYVAGLKQINRSRTQLSRNLQARVEELKGM